MYYDECTLIFKHFPSALSDSERKEFLSSFGAAEIKNFGRGNITAKFSSKKIAEAVIKKLHQREIFGQLISVEFLRGSDLHGAKSVKLSETEENSNFPSIERFLLNLNSWTNLLDLKQPPPAHIKYSYPPPNFEILTNISKMLLKNNKFYTQVIHLMNKMNLPCPFQSDFPVEGDVFVVDSGMLKTHGLNKESTEEESEMEDEEKPVRTFSKGTRLLRKRKRMIAGLLPQPSKPVPLQQVFELIPSKESQAKEIKLTVTGDLSSLKTQPQVETEVINFEPLSPSIKSLTQPETEVPEQETVYSGKVISDEELAKNRISAKEQSLLAVFKNYQAGVPSCRLYIKNLAKSVKLDHLHYIFKKFVVDEKPVQGLMYDIQLLQEGRMKGQAFVTLQSVELTTKALQETNGYILHGKPMVVQFSRSSKPNT